METTELSVSAKWGRWCGYLGLGLLVGFMFLPYSYYLMITLPWMLIWQAGFLLLGISLVITLRQFDQPFRPLGYGLDWAVGAVAIACLLSMIFAPFRAVALWNFVIVVGYGVVLYLLRNWAGQKLWTGLNVWRALVVTGLGMCTSSMAEWFLMRGEADRNLFPLGHHNFVAAYLCLVLPFVVSFALTLQVKEKLLLLALAALFPFNLYFCSSRGGFVGLLAWAIATLAFVIWRTKGRKRIIAASIALFFLTLMMIGGLQHPRVQQIIRVDTSTTIPSISFRVDGETEDRLFMWQAGLNILKDRPLTGVGLGNMSRMYNLYRPLTASSGVAHIQQLHSTPFQLLGELGLIGMGAIAFLLGQMVRLGWRIHQQTTDINVRRFLYGMGGGWFAYGMATLTDYQLENIPISLTLTISTVTLILFADQVFPAQQLTSSTMPVQRGLSLTSLGGLLGAFLTAAPVTYSIHLFWQGQRLWLKGEPEQAFNAINQAYILDGSNPNYPLQFGLWLLETRRFTGQSQEQDRKTTKLAAEYFQEVAQLLPNDFYVNTNMAAVLSELDPIAAQPYLTRAVQLLPREFAQAYLLLSQSYLAQGATDKAIASLAIGGLVDPSVMLLAEWEQDPLKEIRLAVAKKCLSLHQQLLDQLPADDELRLSLEERMAWIAWWHGLPIPFVEQRSQFSPLVQVLLLADTDPDRAAAIVQTQLEQAPEAEKTKWQILRAWFDPNFGFQLTLQAMQDEAEKVYRLTAPPIDQPEPLSQWLKQVVINADAAVSVRVAVNLIYRSQEFQVVDTVLNPQDMQIYQLTSILGLGGSYPRTLPELDRLINQVQRQELGLLHPAQNRFRIAP